MEAKTVTAGRGWEWIVDGWRLFTKNPLMWIVMIIVYAVIGIALSLIPFIGALAYALIAPALVGGMLYSCSRLQNGRELEIGQMFHAFKDKALTTPMLILGAVSLVGSLVIGFVGGGIVMGTMMGAGMMGQENPAALGVAAGGGFTALAVVMVLAVVLFALLFYAIPLVMLSGAAPLDAVKASLAGFLSNWLPLLVFGIVYAVLSIIAMIPFGLGFLVLGPVTVGAVYSSYRDVFGG